MTKLLSTLKNVKWKHYINYIGVTLAMLVFTLMTLIGSPKSSLLYLLENITLNVILTEEADDERERDREDDIHRDLLKQEECRLRKSCCECHKREYYRNYCNRYVVEIVLPLYSVQFFYKLRHYTFSLLFLPRIPVGLTISITTSIANSIAIV